MLLIIRRQARRTSNQEKIFKSFLRRASNTSHFKQRCSQKKISEFAPAVPLSATGEIFFWNCSLLGNFYLDDVDRMHRCVYVWFSNCWISLRSLRVWESAMCVYNFFIAILNDNFSVCMRFTVGPSDRPTPCRAILLMVGNQFYLV